MRYAGPLRRGQPGSREPAAAFSSLLMRWEWRNRLWSVAADRREEGNAGICLSGHLIAVFHILHVPGVSSSQSEDTLWRGKCNFQLDFSIFWEGGLSSVFYWCVTCASVTRRAVVHHTLALLRPLWVYWRPEDNQLLWPWLSGVRTPTEGLFQQSRASLVKVY